MAKSTAKPNRKKIAEESNVDGAKLSASVTVDQHRRLVVHALYYGKTQGELIGELIDAHLREFRVQTNTRPQGRPDDTIDRLEIAGEVMDSGELIAA